MGFVDTEGVREFRADKLNKVGLFETEAMFCDVYCVGPGQEQKLHEHAGATKFYFVLEGRAAVTIGAETRTLRAGELAWSPPGEPHAVRNDTDEALRLLVAMGPNPNFA